MITTPLSGFKHTSYIDLRFADMDAFGHINNAKYLAYFEEARIKYLDDVVQWNYGRSGQGIILARAEVDFRHPVHFKDKIIISTRCSRIGTKSFVLDYELATEVDGEKIISAVSSTVLVMYDYENKNSIYIPDEWKQAMRKYENNPSL